MQLKEIGLFIINIMAAFRWMHVSPAKYSYAWLPRKCDYRTDRRTDRRRTKRSLCAAMLSRRHNRQADGHTDGQTNTGQSDPYVPLCFAGDTKINIVAAFRGMHDSHAKHSYVRLPRNCDSRTDRRTDTQTDAGQSDPYVPLCFAGDTIRRSFPSSCQRLYNNNFEPPDIFTRICLKMYLNNHRRL